MWTVTDSPVGPLRVVEQDGAITAIEFSPFRDADGRPRGAREGARLRLRLRREVRQEPALQHRAAGDLAKLLPPRTR